MRSLRERAQVKYNSHDPAHLEMLRELWQHVFPDSNPPDNCESPRWKDVGFQGNNPGTDFRGAGLTGLQQLIYLVTRQTEDFRRIQSGAVDYPFAISALNITYFLIFYLQLNEKKEVAQPQQRLAPARYSPISALKAFYRLQVQSPEFLEEVYCATVVFMHFAWLRLNKTQHLSIMDFSQAIALAQTQLEHSLLASPRTMAEFLQLKAATLHEDS